MAKGVTYLAVVNKVLNRLREEEVQTVTETDYSTLISTFVNLVKNEIESAWMWMDLRNSWQVTTVAGTGTYGLTGCPPRAKPMDVWNITDGVQLRQIDWRHMNRLYYGTVGGPDQGTPIYWTPNGTDQNGDYQFDFYPPPDAVYTIQFNMYAPTVDLVLDTDKYYGPENAMVEGVLAYAYKERGEDGGMSSKDQFTVYREILGNEIAAEQGQNDNDTTWVVS